MHPEHHSRKVTTNLEGAGHIASEVKKQGMTNVCTQLGFDFFLSYTIWAPYPGNGPTHDQYGPSHISEPNRDSLSQACPEDHLAGGSSRFCQIDN